MSGQPAEPEKKYHKQTFENIPAEKRRRILEVATREFANKGFDNANINVIAQKAGVSVGSLYKYFDTKQALFLTTVHMGIDVLEGTLHALADSREDILFKLEQVIREIQRTSRQSGELIKLYNEMTAEGNSELVQQISADMESVSARVYSGLIRSGQESGEIRRDIDADMAAFLLDNLFMSLQFSYACDYYRARFQIYLGEDVLRRDDFVVEQMLRFVRAALAAPDGRPKP